jgi:hypothetical protein
MQQDNEQKSSFPRPEKLARIRLPPSACGDIESVEKTSCVA